MNIQKWAYVLVIIGALNWGFVGLLGFNFVSAIAGSVAWLEKLIYVLVGVSAFVLVFKWGKK